MSMERAGDAVVVEAYRYGGEPAMPDTCDVWDCLELDVDGDPVPHASVPAADSVAPEVDWQAVLEERTRESFQAGHERGVAQGLEEGRAAERDAQRETRAAELERLAASLSQITGDFAAERTRYFEKVEKEVAR